MAWKVLKTFFSSSTGAYLSKTKQAVKEKIQVCWEFVYFLTHNYVI